MSAQSIQIARKIMEILPFVMRVMASEIRNTEDALSPGQLPVLEALLQKPHQPGELAEKFMVSPPTMSNTINTLEKRGWLTRTRSQNDRRVVYAEITPEGRAVLQRIHEQVESRLAVLLSGMNSEDAIVLDKGLTLLNDVFIAAMAYEQADA